MAALANDARADSKPQHARERFELADPSFHLYSSKFDRYSSLRWLDRFLADILEIDKSFVDTITSPDQELKAQGRRSAPVRARWGQPYVAALLG